MNKKAVSFALAVLILSVMTIFIGLSTVRIIDYITRSFIRETAGLRSLIHSSALVNEIAYAVSDNVEFYMPMSKFCCGEQNCEDGIDNDGDWGAWKGLPENCIVDEVKLECVVTECLVEKNYVYCGNKCTVATEGTDCETGDVCVNTKCLTPCAIDIDCASGTCTDNYCTTEIVCSDLQGDDTNCNGIGDKADNDIDTNDVSELYCSGREVTDIATGTIYNKENQSIGSGATLVSFDNSKGVSSTFPNKYFGNLNDYCFSYNAMNVYKPVITGTNFKGLKENNWYYDTLCDSNEVGYSLLEVAEYVYNFCSIKSPFVKSSDTVSVSGQDYLSKQSLESVSKNVIDIEFVFDGDTKGCSPIFKNVKFKFKLSGTGNADIDVYYYFIEDELTHLPPTPTLKDVVPGEEKIISLSNLQLVDGKMKFKLMLPKTRDIDEIKIDYDYDYNSRGYETDFYDKVPPQQLRLYPGTKIVQEGDSTLCEYSCFEKSSLRETIDAEWCKEWVKQVCFNFSSFGETYDECKDVVISMFDKDLNPIEEYSFVNNFNENTITNVYGLYGEGLELYLIESPGEDFISFQDIRFNVRPSYANANNKLCGKDALTSLSVSIVSEPICGDGLCETEELCIGCDKSCEEDCPGLYDVICGKSYTYETEPCIDGDCKADYTCDTVSGKCIMQTCYDNCKADYVCGNDPTCNNYCQENSESDMLVYYSQHCSYDDCLESCSDTYNREFGTECSETVPCTTGNCLYGYCVLPDCISDCYTGDTCDRITSQTTCETDENCLEGFCVESKCINPEACITKEDCKSEFGEDCYSNYCYSTERAYTECISQSCSELTMCEDYCVSQCADLCDAEYESCSSTLSSGAECSDCSCPTGNVCDTTAPSGDYSYRGCKSEESEIPEGTP